MLIIQISSSEQWHEAEKGKINCHQQKHLLQYSTKFTAYSLHDIWLLYINHHATGTKISKLQKKLKINDIKWLVQSHTTRKQLSLQLLNPVTFIILPPICSLLPFPNTPSLNIWPSSTHSKKSLCTSMPWFLRHRFSINWFSKIDFLSIFVHISYPELTLAFKMK